MCTIKTLFSFFARIMIVLSFLFLLQIQPVYASIRISVETSTNLQQTKGESIEIIDEIKHDRVGSIPKDLKLQVRQPISDDYSTSHIQEGFIEFSIRIAFDDQVLSVPCTYLSGSKRIPLTIQKRDENKETWVPLTAIRLGIQKSSENVSGIQCVLFGKYELNPGPIHPSSLLPPVGEQDTIVNDPALLKEVILKGSRDVHYQNLILKVTGKLLEVPFIGDYLKNSFNDSPKLELQYESEMYAGMVYIVGEYLKEARKKYPENYERILRNKYQVELLCNFFQAEGFCRQKAKEALVAHLQSLFGTDL